MAIGRSTPRSAGRSTPGTDIYWSRMAISHCYCYSLSRQINWQIYPPVLTSIGQEWQFYIATVTAYLGRSTGRSTPPSTDIYWSRMAILHCYCYSLSRQINWQIYPPVLASIGQEWQFHIATVTAHIGRSTGRSTPLSIKHRCLEYHYTKLGISAGRSTPINQA